MRLVRKSLILLWGFMTMSLLTGCGNIGNPNILRAPNSSLSSFAFPAAQDANYSCSYNNSIYPRGDYPANGSGFFSICPSIDTNNWADILVLSTSSFSSTHKICVFPAYQASSVYAKWVPDAKTSLPAYQCSTPDKNGEIYMNFGNVKIDNSNPIEFNAAFIVDEIYASAMVTCLQSGYVTCPPYYSYGEFR